MPDIFIDEESLEVNPITTTEPAPKEVAPAAEEKPPITHHKPASRKFAFSHLFSGYDEDPKSIKFGDQLENEIPLLFLRKHFITNVPWIIIALALSLVPLMIEILFSFSIFNMTFLSTEAKIIIYTFYYFFIISGYIFVNYLTWFYNISLVTNVRVVDVDFSSIVFEDVAATKLSQLEDVSYSQIGIIRSIFDYGDVKLQTAGTASNFEFLGVPHPERVIKVINNLIGKNKHA